MVDVDLLVEQLRRRGHSVGSTIAVPSNAGDYEFEIDGTMLTLEEARALLSEEQGTGAVQAAGG